MRGDFSTGGNSIDAAAPIDFEQQVLRGRVSSSYIRQMSEEKLLIPGRNLVLMDTIGQGMKKIYGHTHTPIQHPAKNLPYIIGEFGVVYRGKLSGWRAQMEQNLVAVKTLKGDKWNVRVKYYYTRIFCEGKFPVISLFVLATRST